MRKNYIDYIKAVGIILVIIGHVNFANEHFHIKEWIYAFHMPLFFFASGLVLKPGRIDIGYVERKVRSLVVPYFIWAMIYAGFSFRNVKYVVYGSYEALGRANSLSSLWFLPVLFCGLMIAKGFISVCKKTGYIVIGMAVCFAVSVCLPYFEIGYPWCADVGVMAAAFIMAGYLFENKIAERMSAGMFGVTAAAGAGLSFLFMINKVEGAAKVMMARNLIGNPGLFVCAALGGCLMVYSAVRLLERWRPESRGLSFVGRNTLVIFAVQKPVISVFHRIFEAASIGWAAELVITTIGVLAVSCLASLIINRYAPVLNGK